jgi:antitoxin HicB
MNRYSMVIQWSEEDQAFIVKLPEFPNCRTHGATYEEAVKNGQEVLELVIESYREEGTPLPEPNLLRVA